MTQPATQPVTPAITTAEVDAEADAPEAPDAPRPMTMADVIGQVDAFCSREIGPLPSTRLLMWFPRRTAPETALLVQATESRPDISAQQKARDISKFLQDLEPSPITPGKACPLDEGLTVIWMFPRDGQWYLYCLPLSKNDDVNKREVLASKPPTRFVLSMRGPQFSVEVMPLQTWLLEVADELEAVDGNTRTVPEGMEEDPGEGEGDDED